MHEQMNLETKTVNKSKWHITDEQFELINVINLDSRLYFALQVKFYEHYHSFFESFADIPQKAIKLICKQLNITFKLSKQSVSTRTVERYRAKIRDYFQSRRLQHKDEVHIKNWLFNTVFPQESLNLEQLKERIREFLTQQKIECPSEYGLEQLIKSSQYQHEEKLFENIFLLHHYCMSTLIPTVFFS